MCPGQSAGGIKTRDPGWLFHAEITAFQVPVFLSRVINKTDNQSSVLVAEHPSQRLRFALKPERKFAEFLAIDFENAGRRFQVAPFTLLAFEKVAKTPVPGIRRNRQFK